MYGLMMEAPLTIDRILEHARRVHGGKRVTTKLPDGSLHRYSYADLHARVGRLCGALASLGVRPGDRVATFSWNNHQHLELYYGIPAMGAVCHTLNIRLFPEQLAYIVNHAEDKVVFLDATLLPLYEKVADQIRCVEHYVVFNSQPDCKTTLPNVQRYEDLLASALPAPVPSVDDERTAMGLCYTSGTTGNPKGVLYSHRSMYLHTLGGNQACALGVREDDVVLPVVPMFHAMAWGLPYSALLAGADVVMPGPHLGAPALADLIASEGVTIAAGVPTIWNALYHELKARPRDLSRLRLLIVGGSAMPRALIEGYEKDLGVEVLHAWGMTETSPVGTTCRLKAADRARPAEERWNLKARQGYAVPGVELRIVDLGGQPLPWDGATLGELQIRGPWVARAYFKVDPSEESFTKDGWFRTGDVATISPDGLMGISDRTKDLVKSGGEWISTVELETSLMAHPSVLEAAVIAIPDERWAERPMAVVVLKPGAAPIVAADVTDYLAPRFAKFWLPDRVAFVAEIPKTSVGKFDKKVLRQRFADGKLG